MDYRKLNASKRKDYFPLPFTDQMFERLAGKTHYYCLDGYSGFIKFLLLSKSKKRPLSVVHSVLLHSRECHSVCVMLQPPFKGV